MGLGLTAEGSSSALFAAAEAATGLLFGDMLPVELLPVDHTTSENHEPAPLRLPRDRKPRIRLGDPLPAAVAAVMVEAKPRTVGPAAAIEPADSAASLTRARVVERILELNPTVGEEFLERFDAAALGSYLDRLIALQHPRGGDARWVRRGDTPAILGRERIA